MYVCLIIPFVFSHYRMSFPNKEDRIKCWGRRDEYWQCLDEGKSQMECIEFRKQYEKFCPSQWVGITDNVFLDNISKDFLV